MEEAASKASWVFLQKQEKASCKKDLVIEPAIVRKLTRNVAACSYLTVPAKQRYPGSPHQKNATIFRPAFCKLPVKF